MKLEIRPLIALRTNAGCYRPFPVALRRDAGGYRLSVFRALPRSTGGVQEFQFCREAASRVVGKLKQE